MKLTIAVFLRQIAVFCSTILFLFCFMQLSGCSSSNPPPVPQIPVASAKQPATKNEYVVKGKLYHVLNNVQNYHQVGTASWYGKKFQGRRTSTCERYNLYGMTAASPVLPLPTYIKVTNLKNGKQVFVKVNDRGPFRNNRILDLSYAAAKKLGFVHQGLAQVEIEAVAPINIATNITKNSHKYSNKKYPHNAQEVFAFNT